MIDGNHSRITFRVKCTAAPGQVVAISGDCSGLGFFRRSSAICLVTTPEEYPVWRTATPIVVPTNQLIQYKYCLLEGGSFQSFENIERNRTVFPEEFNIVVDDVFSPLHLEGAHGDSESDLISAFEALVAKMDSQSVPKAHLDEKIGSGASRLFLVCYHLPITVKRLDNSKEPFEVSWSESLLAQSENSVAKSLDTYWVGTIPSVVAMSPPITNEEQAILKGMLKSFHCIPLFIEKQLTQAHYHGFCKQVLWPLFHNVDQLDAIHSVWKLPKSGASSGQTRSRSNTGSGTRSRSNTGPPLPTMLSTPLPRSESGSGTPPNASPTSATATPIASSSPNSNNINTNVVEELNWTSTDYSSYLQVNKIFADVIRPMLKAGDVIWVHDYHLMLLPKQLRESSEYQNVRMYP